MTKKILQYLDISKIGILEMLVALYPILMGYKYGMLRCDILCLLLMDVIAINKKRDVIQLNGLKYLSIFIVLHEIVLCVTMSSTPSYHINSILSYCVNFISLFIIIPAIDFSKLRSSIVIVAIISILGIIYHFLLLQLGHDISPIKIPFMPEMDTDTRLYDELDRPCSFFWEPQSFCNFLLVPLFYSLNEKKYAWTTIVVFAMFLSTSTTGIALSLLSIGIFASTQKLTRFQRFSIVIMGCVMVYILLNADIFSAGVDKIEGTDYEKTSRLYNGPTLIANMPLVDLITGINSPNVTDYYMSGNVKAFLIVKHDNVYVSTFWLILAKYGVFGLLLYLNLFFDSVRRNKRLLVYIAPLFVALFTNPDAVGASFVFEFLIIYSFCKSKNNYLL